MNKEEMLSMQLELLVRENDKLTGEISTLCQEHLSMRARNERLEWENERLEKEVSRLYDILTVRSSVHQNS